jgi:hypothetical protein
MNREHARPRLQGGRPGVADRAGRRVVAALLMLSGVVTLPRAVAANATACPGVASHGPWSTIAMPPWSTAPGEVAIGDPLEPWPIRRFAIDPMLPSHLFATDGHELMRSLDGGCRWRRVFSLYTSGAPADASSDMYPWLKGGYLIQSVVAGSKGVVYLTLTTSYLKVHVSTAPVFIAASHDGESWVTRQVRVGTSIESRVTSTANGNDVHTFTAPSDPSTVYVLTTSYGDNPLYALPGALSAAAFNGGYRVLVSHDGAATWTYLGYGAYDDTVPMPSAMADPKNPDTVWSTGDYGWRDAVSRFEVARSTNGARTFHASLAGIPVGVHGFDPPYLTANKDGSQTCLLARSTAAAAISADGGRRWTPLPPVPRRDAHSGPAALEGAACIGAGRALALAGYQPTSSQAPPFRRSSLFVHTPGHRWQRITDVPAVLGTGSMLVAGPTRQPTIFWVGYDFYYGGPGVTTVLRYTGLSH